LSVFLYFFLQKTDTGRAIRATAQDREAAEVLGINVSFIYLLTFGLGAACVGAAGALISTYFYIFPRVGTVFSLAAFIVCVVGGMGNYIGAFIGGLIIGVAEALGGFLIGPELKQVVSFIIFILILWFKPEGIFGKALRKR
jgi:branched-chain amino acid transport system permease protein